MTVKVSILSVSIYCISHGLSGNNLCYLLTPTGLHCITIHPLEISVTEQLKNLSNREGLIDAVKHKFPK
jgi:NAD-dependent oxidoreductase involved in siderophore biosynthesis